METIIEEGKRYHLPSPSWGIGPSGTCIIWTLPPGFDPPPFFEAANVTYKLAHFRLFPPGYAFSTDGEDVDFLLRECFALRCDELPGPLSAAVEELLREASPEGKTTRSPVFASTPVQPAGSGSSETAILP